jgi:IclR family acetate operon transcriptional repressor
MTLKKGLKILEVFLMSNWEASLTEISNLAEVNVSTAYRICNILEKHRYLTRNSDTRKYSLGPMILSLGSSLTQNDFLFDIAKSYMRALCKDVQEVTTLAILDDLQAVIINRIEEIERVLIPQYRIGARLPLHSTSVGKVLLSRFQDSELDKILNKINYEKFTKYSNQTKEKLLKDIEFIQRYGYGINDREYSEEIRAIAAPIKSASGIVIAAIAIDVPAHRIKLNELQALAPKILETANLISEQLGYIKRWTSRM